MRAPTSTNVAQTLSIKAGTAKRFSISREIAGLSSDYTISVLRRFREG
jgi:hypothetical protein